MQDDNDRLQRLLRAEKDFAIEDDTVGGQQGNLLLELQREGQAAQRGAAGGRGVEASAPVGGPKGKGGVAGSEAKASEKGLAEGAGEGGESTLVMHKKLAFLLICRYSFFLYPAISSNHIR